MLATSELNDSNLFGQTVSVGEGAEPGVPLGKGAIHVLVVLTSKMNINPSRDPERIVMLFCVVVGMEESAFPVDIGVNMSVGELKMAIKVRQQYQFPASKLNLYMAESNNK
ncbi:hypothetical protein P3T76_013288 [Phytophthora citrophthora]|uniref:Crinkler effector protein N-terminal domain-containing protein n=1 Tax=Phytophthora citrophthora TaxID=4793 RepID=A0AAD9G326_9STRA|nr:hypothetical protein P3T76_013288 [Phytophthora citrophthora]